MLAKEPTVYRQPNEVTMSLLLLLNRLGLGGYMAATGLRKVAAELRQGIGTFLRGDAYLGRQPSWLPDFVATTYGYALPWVELLLGLLILLGLCTRVSAWLLVALLTSIALALAGAGELIALTAVSETGERLLVTRVHHINVMVPVALLLAAVGGGRWSIDSLCPRCPSKKAAHG
jgi:putative oxidoreductase